jgi:hypothetical protein
VVAAWIAVFGPLLRWLTPARRRLALSLAALFLAIRIGFDTMEDAGAALAIALSPMLVGFVLACFALARRFRSLPAPLRRHPQLALHAVLWLLLIALWTGDREPSVMRTILIGMALALPFLLWRLGYMMFAAQRGKLEGARVKDHLFYLFPVWGGTHTPYGKGPDYLAANEAADEEALAKSQLAAIKLFVLAGLWSLAKDLMQAVVYGDQSGAFAALHAVSPDFPKLHEMLADPGAYPTWVCWIGLYLGLIWAVLALAVKGHLIIGYLRFTGFNVFRNTYKPLAAETVVEFWNRYYYYFKELLVHFFFFPTYSRYFKSHPRLRLFTAVFAAAFVGNMYYHLIPFDPTARLEDFPALDYDLQSRLFYCLLLSVGIFISMQRSRGKIRGVPGRSLPRRLVAIFGVWTFFSIIHIWAEQDPAPFLLRCRFFFGLFGLP